MCVDLALVIGAASSLSLALPDIAESTGATHTELTWVVYVYALAFAALLLPVGIATDRWGRRQFLVASLALFAVASLASGLVDQPGTPHRAARPGRYRRRRGDAGDSLSAGRCLPRRATTAGRRALGRASPEQAPWWGS